MYLYASGSGYPILFIHGIPTNGGLWSGIAGRLSDRFTCFAIDLPGLGRTPRSATGLRHLDSIIAGIEDIRIARQIDRWHIVGHDAGSAIAAHYAFRYPERASRLVLMSPALFPELKPFYLFQILRRRVIGELLAPLVNQMFWKIAMRYAIDARPAELSRTVADFYAPFSGPLGSWRLMSILRWGDPREVLAAVPAFLPKLNTPTLIFHGSRDAAVPASFAHRASALIPNSRLVVLDSGHFIPLSDPAGVAAELLRFFAQS